MHYGVIEFGFRVLIDLYDLLGAAYLRLGLQYLRFVLEFCGLLDLGSFFWVYFVLTCFVELSF